MTDQTREKVQKLKKAYSEFEKKLDELKEEEHEFINEIIEEFEKREIKGLLDKIEQIED